MTDAVIRKAVPADVPGMMPVVARYWAFEQVGHFDADRVQAALSAFLADSPFGVAWVAEWQGRVAGYLISTFTFSLEHGGKMADIDEFFIIPEARSQGLGTALLKTAEEYLSANGFCRWQLQIARDNHSGRAFYTRHGFRPRDRYDLMDRGLQA